MQLILNKELINRKDNKIKSNIVIVSTRKWVIEKISEKIRLADINDIKEIDKDIFNLSTINTPEKTVGFIIDIGNNQDVEKTLSLIKSNTPRDCWCVLVGDIDSISIAQKFTERGILYLNVQSQSIELTQHLLKGIPIESERKAFFISILGCKGGIGTTLLSYHFSCEITQIKKSPTLLLQGNQGSQDIDLVTEKKMTSEINEYHKNIDIMLCKGNELSDIDIKIGRKHNYIVFDQSIHNSPKEKLAGYIEHSDCIIILLDNSMTSVRVAKDFIDIYDRFKRDNRQTTRLIVCLNESRPISKNMLNTSDIQSLLGRKIDTQIPYISKTKESLVDKNYFGRSKVKIIDLAKNTLGINIHLSKNGKSWINKIAASLK
ncbi:pilus assembly protein CpaE [Yersinia enterocolitica]|uniref:pilus assembly protein CpaE n=1 Tax=Yersinia enterocolitica TaxID=630 RepID=UPI00061CCC63|nr:pilus assembly protein CpaE [Yersinia enterocolitica]EKN6154665.1 pilus assembly protein CpaE [Yersinia enterocolitica]ELI7922232.1 pilus assembly protein CpaE [Yersinia enterocolitica]CNB25221.1 putative tight adherance operon protein [Yersinia enterocolitica]HDL6742828.1 pilus assembly protein CpaE [Yersinia enterocolitica]HDL6937267.1 pilus assembly protein CpaE [Yersinia enterocolitica]